MAIVNRTIAKTYFNTGDKPTESQFGDFIDSALFYEDTSNFGRSLVSAQSAVSARNLLGSGTVGNNLFTAITTASAQQNIGGGIVGKQVFEAITTASGRSALDAQPLNNNLTAFAGLSGSADKIPLFTGAGTITLVNRISPTIQKFTSGSGTYLTPANVLYLKIKMTGGGGGGGGSGSASGTSAGDGGTTTFGSSLLTATGGIKGARDSAGGAGGSATINSPAIGTALSGGFGSGAMGLGGTAGIVALAGGAGGNNVLGGGGGGGNSSAAGVAGTVNTGGGGGGAGCTGSALQITASGGGAGGYIEAIIPNPSSTYSYAVGSGGASGGAGTGGFAGGTGGSGYIEITEYYN